MLEGLTIATTDAAQAVKTYTATEVLSPYMGVFFAAFCVALVATPIMRRVALANGIVDWPDKKRKAHAEPVAYLGGLAVFLGWLAGVIVCFKVAPHNNSAAVQFPLSIITGAAIITIAGLADDVMNLSPRVKVGFQLFAAAFLVTPFLGNPIGVKLIDGVIKAVLSLASVDPVGMPGYEQVTYWLGAATVAFLVLGGCNAANLLDGLDGLATGVTSIVALGFTFISVALAMGLYAPEVSTNGYSVGFDPVRVVTCLALLGAVLGFLPWNFNPATIFMGDAGSMLLGYLCITNVLLFAERGDPALVMAGLMVFALPILDTALALVRRKMRGQGLFAPDNQHLHHQLIRSGLTVKQSVVLLYLMAFGFAAVGCSLVFIRMRFVAAIFLFVFAFITIMAYKIGHKQFIDSLPEDERDKYIAKPKRFDEDEETEGGSGPAEGAA